jgi:hypothetical protein
VDALHAVIQQAWTGETVPRSWRGFCNLPYNITKRGFLWILKNFLYGMPQRPFDSSPPLEGVLYKCVQCTRRAINSIVKTIEGFASWTWHTKSSPKFYMTAFYPHAVQHCQAAFQSGKSTTDQHFALRQVLEKCYVFNITTHHLFINFKAAYDTIIRNEV